MPPAALPGGQILKIWTNRFGDIQRNHLQNMFVKLYKSLAPGKAAGGLKNL
jgi:hypothetical protein